MHLSQYDDSGVDHIPITSFRTKDIRSNDNVSHLLEKHAQKQTYTSRKEIISFCVNFFMKQLLFNICQAIQCFKDDLKQDNWKGKTNTVMR